MYTYAIPPKLVPLYELKGPSTQDKLCVVCYDPLHQGFTYCYYDEVVAAPVVIASGPPAPGFKKL